MFKYLISAVAGAILAYFKLYHIAYIFIVVVALLDIVTGIAASIVDGTGLSSQKAFKGVVKKLILFVTLGFGTFLDVFIPYAAGVVNVNMPESLLFSTIVCVYITITECISIVENIYRCDNAILPTWILKILKKAKSEIDAKGDDENDESSC